MNTFIYQIPLCVKKRGGFFTLIQLTLFIAFEALPYEQQADEGQPSQDPAAIDFEAALFRLQAHTRLARLDRPAGGS